MSNLYRAFKRFILWLRFGTIQQRIVDKIEGTVCEIEFTGRGGKVIGYWAYGDCDPSYPYRGQ